MSFLKQAIFTLISTMFLYKVSQSSSCEIDFHIESPSVMVLEGSNASALCDASCFGHFGDLEVIWLDRQEEEIESQSDRISAVLENGGLMNRLTITGARSSDSGMYLCTVMRNGELLDEKPLSFYVLGNSNNNANKIQDDGPRRGDIVPRQDIEYRPVRSLDRILARIQSSMNHGQVRRLLQESEAHSQKKNPINELSILGIESALYRRHGPDNLDSAPLTLLDDPVEAGEELAFGNENLRDADTSLSSEEEEVVPKKEDIKEDAGLVSTFLLRQLSQTEGNTKSENALEDVPSDSSDLQRKPSHTPDSPAQTDNTQKQLDIYSQETGFPPQNHVIGSSEPGSPINV